MTEFAKPDQPASIPSITFLVSVGGLAFIGAIASTVGLLSDPAEDAAEIVYAGSLALALVAAGLTASIAEDRRRLTASNTEKRSRELRQITLRASGLARAVDEFQADIRAFFGADPEEVVEYQGGGHAKPSRAAEAFELRRRMFRQRIDDAYKDLGDAEHDIQSLVEAGALEEAERLSKALPDARALLKRFNRR